MSSLLLLLTTYQNCGGSLTTLSSADRTSSSLCEGECSSVDGVGDETSSPSDGNERGGNENDLIEVADDSPITDDDEVVPPEVPPPGDDGTQPPSANQ